MKESGQNGKRWKQSQNESLEPKMTKLGKELKKKKSILLGDAKTSPAVPSKRNLRYEFH